MIHIFHKWIPVYYKKDGYKYRKCRVCGKRQRLESEISSDGLGTDLIWKDVKPKTI